MAKSAGNLNCPKCSFVGKSAQSLKVHIGRAHKRGKRKKTKAKARAGRGRGRARGIRCASCGKVLKTPAALKAHMTRMHKGRRASVGAKKRRRQAATGTGKASPLQRRLMGLTLAEVADLHSACRSELQRRLTEMVD